MLNDIVENRLIASLVQGYRRSPLQANGLHETDAEILRLNDACSIAITTDSIAEEVEIGLYEDPWLIGWMAVMANLSDLAAVGALPLGLVLSEILPSDFSQESLKRLQQGIRDACERCGTFVLGGDTNAGTKLIITGTAFGLNTEGRFLTRTGCRPGDCLYATGSLGTGSAYALSVLMTNPGGENSEKPVDYRPVARVREGAILKRFASSCMDTSDGVLATLDQLVRLNRLGFELTAPWNEALDTRVREMASERRIPEWLFLAGQHGEFELLFTIPVRSVALFEESALAGGWQPRLLGRVVAEPVVRISINEQLHVLDTGRIRNIPWTAGPDPGKQLEELLAMHTALAGHEQTFYTALTNS